MITTVPAAGRRIRCATIRGVRPRVFVTGSTGFVGKHVLRALVSHGCVVRCLVRRGSEADLRGFESIDRVPGDVLDPKGN